MRRRLPKSRKEAPAKSARVEPHKAVQVTGSLDSQYTGHAELLRFQTLVGNQQTQRLLQRGFASSGPVLRRAPLQSTATVPDAASPESPTGAPSAETSASPTPVADEEMTIEEGMYVGNAEFHAKADPKNQYYSENPPLAGWPYTDLLKSLWQGKRRDDFADEVAGFQYFTLKLPESEVDGVLGPSTSRRLQEKNEAAATTEPSEPAAEGESQEPVRGTTAAQGRPSGAGTRVSEVDPTIKNHTVVKRIVKPVEEAFSDYQSLVKSYEAANSAAQKAKKPGEKTAKEEEKQKKLNDVELGRIKARDVMKAARDQAAALTAAELTGGERELRSVRGYINQELNARTTYYTQMQNANILYGQGHAAALRTCNMTVVSMMLEALGKSTKDYSGDVAQLQALSGEFGEQLGINNATPDAISHLRLPDFLQLVAIQVAGSREKAAASITSHKFITDVLRSFGLTLTEMKGQESAARKEATSFLSTKFTSKLDTFGALYRPARSEARKSLAKDETYKKLDKARKQAYADQKLAQVLNERRTQYLTNLAAWIEVDNQAKEPMTALQAELDKPNSADPGKPRAFDAELQAAVDLAIQKLGEIAAGMPTTKEMKGKLKQINGFIKSLQAAQKQDAKKPEAAPKRLRALFDGKGKNDPLTLLESNLKKYEGLKGLYETLGEQGGIEKLLPIEDYKASVIPIMTSAIEAGNQVMVNLENHFVRLQSVGEDGFVIDDPGNTRGEDNKISWEQGREFGYFQHYLLVSP